MPYVEMGTSRQDSECDSLGNVTVRRVFKVWGVSPSTVYLNPGSINNPPDPTNPFLNYMPDYGDTIDAAVYAPNAITGGPAGGVKTRLRLYKYTTTAISPVIFFAVAHYTNDPKEAPYGLGYSSVEQFTIVNIPYVRKVGIIRAGQSGGGPLPFAYVESIKPEPMGVKKIRQEIMYQRRRRAEVEQGIQNQTGFLNLLPNIGWCRFDGGDVRMISAQQIHVSYNWTWEEGVDFVNRSYVSEPEGTTINAIYPQGGKSLDSQIDGDNIRVLHPFHTIELQYNYDVRGVRIPIWVYRLPYFVSRDGWRSLPDSDFFEWVLVP